MILYIDTSVLVSVITNETNSIEAAKWLYSRSADIIAISPWTRTEFSSALSLKVRSRQIDQEAQRIALTGFNQFAMRSAIEFQVTEEDFLTAARWCENFQTGLRSGDALHLSIARRNLATLCTLDQTLALAGKQLAVDTLLV